MKNQETLIVNSIIESVRKKYPNVFIHKNVVANVKLGSGFYSQVGLGVSSSDLILCVNGKFVCFECKVPGKFPTLEQNEWGRMIRKYGGIYECVRCIQDAFKFIDAIINGSYNPGVLE